MSQPDLSAGYLMSRKLILEADDAGHQCRERAFHFWRLESLFPQAVVRLITAIGGKVK